MTEPLTITTSSRPDRQLELTITMGPERTEQALQRAARQLAKRVNIPGFRRGKAPYQTVLRHYGREALLNEILDDLGQEVYREALDAEKIEPFGIAQVEDIALDPPTFKLVVPLPPEVDLGDYRSIRVEASEVNVTDADVEKTINEQRAARATWVPIDRPAEMGDTVTLDIKGTVGEDSIMDNHDWDLLLKEESGWLPGFAEAFVGSAAGDQKAFTLRYPEESSSRYKGQEASFEATVKQVKTRLEPELNDEFATSLGEYTDLQDLQAKTRAQLVGQRTAEAENKLNEAGLDALIEKAQLSFPPAAVEETLNDMMEDVRRNLSRSGYSLEDFVRLQGMSLEDYKERMRPSAEKRLKGRLVLGKLSETERIQVSPEDIRAQIDRMAPADDENEQAHAFRDVLEGEAGQNMLRQDLITEKTLVRLREIVTGKAPELPPAESELPAPQAEAAPQAAPESPAAARETEAPEPAGPQDEVSTWEAGTALGDASTETADAEAQPTGAEDAPPAES